MVKYSTKYPLHQAKIIPQYQHKKQSIFTYIPVYEKNPQSFEQNIVQDNSLKSKTKWAKIKQEF